jgi:hypothetical protein
MLDFDQTKGNEMKPSTFQGTYAEWYQTIEKPRLAAITPEVRARNAASHIIGNVDDCARCINCEIGSWNAWKSECAA